MILRWMMQQNRSKFLAVYEMYYTKLAYILFVEYFSAVHIGNPYTNDM